MRVQVRGLTCPFTRLLSRYVGARDRVSAAPIAVPGLLDRPAERPDDGADRDEHWEEVETVGELGRLVQAYRDRQKYPVSDARIAAAIGVSRSSVGNWVRGTATPSPEHLRALALHIETSYLRVFEAAMADAGYLPKERDGHGDAAPTNEGATAPTPPTTAEHEQEERERTEPAPTRPAAADSAPRRGPKVVPADDHGRTRTRSTGRREHGHS